MTDVQPARSPSTRRAPSLVLRAADATEAVQLGSNRVTFAIAGSETGQAYSLTDFVMAPPPAPGPPPHIHPDSDEVVYVLEGQLMMSVGEQTLTGGPGAVMLAPRGTRHSLANPGPDFARLLVILSPPGYEGFWRETAQLQAQQGPLEPAMIRALQEKYHLVTDGEVRQFD
jgi:quercetin dioxygenase-like cupin family protein